MELQINSSEGERLTNQSVKLNPDATDVEVKTFANQMKKWVDEPAREQEATYGPVQEYRKRANNIVEELKALGSQKV